MERLFVVSTATTVPEIVADETAVRAYLYGGWEITGFDDGPQGTFAGFHGFYVTRTNDANGPGFGAQALRDRLSSGLRGSVDCSTDENGEA